MAQQTFNYNELKKILEEDQAQCPELIPAIQNYWTTIQNYWRKNAGFTMTEVIPILKDYFSKKYNCFYMIQSRYVLTNNPLKSIWDAGTYHLALEYYAHPNSIYILLQNHIIWNKKACNFQKNEQNKILLTPMDVDQLDTKEKYDRYLENQKSEGNIIWLATEEGDFTFDELQDYQNWESQKIPLEDRSINSEIPDSIIIQYISERENSIFTKGTSYVKK